VGAVEAAVELAQAQSDCLLVALRLEGLGVTLPTTVTRAAEQCLYREVEVAEAAEAQRQLVQQAAVLEVRVETDTSGFSPGKATGGEEEEELWAPCSAAPMEPLDWQDQAGLAAEEASRSLLRVGLLTLVVAVVVRTAEAALVVAVAVEAAAWSSLPS